MSVPRTRKKRVVALVGIAAAVAIGGGVAFAYWTGGGTGTGSATTGTATQFEVNSSRNLDSPDLIPGGPAQSENITVYNSAAGPETLSSITVTVANDDGTAWTAVPGCSSADFTVSDASFTAGPIASASSILGTVTVTMNDLNTNQDACKGINVPLYVVAA